MKVGFFEEAEGIRSSLRLIVIVGAFWVMGMCSYWTVVFKTPPMTIVGAFSAMMTTIGSIKIIQRNIENKETPQENSK
jgi:hypothetical protein